MQLYKIPGTNEQSKYNGYGVSYIPGFLLLDGSDRVNNLQ